MRQCSSRIFLKCGLGDCPASALIPPLPARPVMPYYKAVFDERFQEARAFATQATARVTPTVAICGDVTNLFFIDLDPRWKLGPVWLIGLTTSPSLFCPHLLARDRMKTHSASSDASDLVLWIIAPSAGASAKKIANA